MVRYFDAGALGWPFSGGIASSTGMDSPRHQASKSKRKTKTLGWGWGPADLAAKAAMEWRAE
jgi:hypothetical protein